MAQAHTGTRLGGSAFNHQQSSNAEAEYDRLRDLARQEHSKMESCFARSQQAYGQHDGGRAHDLSQEGKKHQAAAAKYNQQASEFIFRENNATDRVPADTIDLHGQFVEEAEQILETRIREARSQNQTHLHVIVGKGNHSPGHVQKIKPRVEQVCRELGLQYATEENAGRIYINLQGGPAQMPPDEHFHQQYQQQPYGGYGGGGGGGGAYPGQPQQQFEYGGGPQPQQQQQQQQDPFIGCLKSLCKMM